MTQSEQRVAVWWKYDPDQEPVVIYEETMPLSWKLPLSVLGLADSLGTDTKYKMGTGELCARLDPAIEDINAVEKYLDEDFINFQASLNILYAISLYQKNCHITIERWSAA